MVDLNQIPDFLLLIRLLVKVGMRRTQTATGCRLKTTHADTCANRGDEHALNHRKSGKNCANPNNGKLIGSRPPLRIKDAGRSGPSFR
jgi:hypothetical protein